MHSKTQIVARVCIHSAMWITNVYKLAFACDLLIF